MGKTKKKRSKITAKTMPLPPFDSFTVAVLPVADNCKHIRNVFCDQQNHPETFLQIVGDWFKKISNNRCCLDFILLPTLIFPQNLNAFSSAGGMGPPPQNSQALVEKLLPLADRFVLKSLQHAEGRLVIVTPGRFKPHTWHIPNGGKLILTESSRHPGRQVVCRRYSVVPDKPNLGMLAHELGHLLFGWPDLKWPRAYAKECLMAEGASNDSGKSPAEPCAPLLHRQGWRDELKIEGHTPVHSLNRGNIGIADWDGKKILVEFRSQRNTDAKSCFEKPRLLVYKCETKGYSKIIMRKYLENYSANQKLLGLIASLLRCY